MNLKNIIIAILSLLFLMIGADKFLMFLEPPCSLMDSIHPTIWKLLGVLQLGAGIFIWLPKFRKYIVGFFFIFMLAFTAVHLSQSSYDIGGAIFLAALLGILLWNPPFINPKESTKTKI